MLVLCLDDAGGCVGDTGGGWGGMQQMHHLCSPRPLSSTQSRLHSAGCCYDTTREMTLELNTLTSCYVLTQSGKIFSVSEAIKMSCPHRGGVKLNILLQRLITLTMFDMFITVAFFFL